jgi:hypothetical protein
MVEEANAHLFVASSTCLPSAANRMIPQATLIPLHFNLNGCSVLYVYSNASCAILKHGELHISIAVANELPSRLVTDGVCSAHESCLLVTIK